MRSKDIKKEEDILAATLRLTGKKGIAGLTIAAIAREAKVASGTLYLYFTSKEELLNQLYANLKAKSSLELMPNLSSLSLREQFFQLWDANIRYRLDNFGEVVFMEQFIISPFISMDNINLAQKFNSHLINMIERGQAEGIIRSSSPELLLTMLSGFSKEFSHTLQKDKHSNVDQQIKDSFTVCWAALAV